MQENNKYNIKLFLIKLFAISIAIILIINVIFNTIFADKLDFLNKLMSLNNKQNIEIFKNKLRKEIKNGLSKERILNEEDKKLIIQIINKIKDELKE